MQNAFKDASLEASAICLIRERIARIIEASMQANATGAEGGGRAGVRLNCVYGPGHQVIRSHN